MGPVLEISRRTASYPKLLRSLSRNVLSLMPILSPIITPTTTSHLLKPKPEAPHRLGHIRALSSVVNTAPPFDLRTYWSSLISTMDAELASAVPLRYPHSIHESMRYSVLSPGAKRAPPVMCVASACDLLGSPRAAAFPTAAALEMVHSASLIHDDLPCMDSAPFRRGRPSNHSVFGPASAVLAGDALFPLAFHHILRATPRSLVPDPALLSVVAEIARAVGSAGMAAGQFLDLSGSTAGVMEVLERKFGEMAECSAVCGGIIGGAEEEVLDVLRRYGRSVGVLYQVVDDVIMEGAGDGVKMRSNASVVKAFGIEKAMEVVEELKAKAMSEVRTLEGKFGEAKAAPLRSFVEYAVERGFDVKVPNRGGKEDENGC